MKGDWIVAIATIIMVVLLVVAITIAWTDPNSVVNYDWG